MLGQGGPQGDIPTTGDGESPGVETCSFGGWVALSWGRRMARRSLIFTPRPWGHLERNSFSSAAGASKVSVKCLALGTLPPTEGAQSWQPWVTKDRGVSQEPAQTQWSGEHQEAPRPVLVSRRWKNAGVS